MKWEVNIWDKAYLPTMKESYHDILWQAAEYSGISEL